MKSFQLKAFAENKHDLKITGHVVYHPGHLTVQFHLDDPDRSVEWRAPSIAKRTVGLWRETCFEFFVKNKLSTSYLEVNLSPSHEWNAFWFNSPGDELAELPAIHVLPVNVKGNSIATTINTQHLPEGFITEGQVEMNVSAVIKDNTGDLSYWALCHPESGPDFHDFRGFILHL